MKSFLGKGAKIAGYWALIFLFLILFLTAALTGQIDTASGAEAGNALIYGEECIGALYVSGGEVRNAQGQEIYNLRTFPSCNYCHETGRETEIPAGYINPAQKRIPDPNSSKDLSAVATGAFEFGIGKSSVTNLESMDLAMDLKIKETTIKFLLNSQQKDRKMEVLNIEADFQHNLIFNKKMFGFGSFGYLRDLSWYDDFIRIGAGLGYMGITNLKIQSGVHWAIVNQEKVYNRKTLSKTTVDFTIPLGGVFTFRQIMDFELNLGEIHGINSVLNDYLTSLDAAVTADITKTIFFKARYRWRYIDNPMTAAGNQREYRLTLGARL